jgi:hypothetical protein
MCAPYSGLLETVICLPLGLGSNSLTPTGDLIMSSGGVKMAFAVALAAVVGTPVDAGPLVTVTVSEGLAAKSQKLGPREIDYLTAQLKRQVESALNRSATSQDLTAVRLTLVDATPNRPTLQQMFDRPGLSYESLSLGGAEIRGQFVLNDGTINDFKFRWYESDLTNVIGLGTWSDASWTFSRFAKRLADGRLLSTN